MNIDDLTAKQCDLLMLLSQGLTEPQIAERMNVHRVTVGYRKAKLAKQLGITPRQLKWRAQHHKERLRELIG